LLLLRVLRRRTPTHCPAFHPPVTVFKPLKGIDSQLRANLESFFQQDYPCFELIFGVSDLDDPAIPIVRRLQAEYPEIASTLVVESYREGYNPKVNNLCNMAPHARFGTWVISDSNVRVEPTYLAKLVAPLRDPGVGLVTSLIRGVGGKRLGAHLENLHLNSFVAAGTIAVNHLSRIPVSIGKSMAFRRATLERLGGFGTFANYLLEDGLIGRQIRNLGLQTVIGVDTVDNINTAWTVRDFLARHYRWALMRRRLNLLHYLGEILASPIFLASAAFALSPSWVTVGLAVSAFGVRAACDLATVRSMNGSVSLLTLPLVGLKDILMAFTWCRPFFTDRVTWRGHQFRIGRMTRITPVLPTSSFRRGADIRGRRAAGRPRTHSRSSFSPLSQES